MELADRLLHMSVLKQLMGDQVRDIVKGELKLAFAEYKESLGREPEPHDWGVGRAPSRESASIEFESPKASCEGGSGMPRRLEPTDHEARPRVDACERGDMEQQPTISIQVANFGHLPIRTVGEAIAANMPTRARGFVLEFERRFNMLGASDAPPRYDCVSRFADTTTFESISNLAILLNSVFMVYAADQAISNYLEGPSPFVATVDNIFLGFYTFEFIVKIIRYRMHFFYDRRWKFNWLDLLILVISYSFLTFADDLPNIGALRILRVLKFANVLRVFHLIDGFQACRAILVSLSKSVSTFFWSMFMLTIYIFMFAMFFVFSTANYFEEKGSSLDPGQEEELKSVFGSVSQAMLSLYMATTGGNDWGFYYDALYQTGWLNPGLYLLFVAFAQMALLNIVLGIFADHAQKSMLNETETQAKEHAEAELQVEADLRSLCEEADHDGDGKITWSEWKSVVVEGKMQSYLDALGFRASDIMEYFKVLSEKSQTGEVDIDSFLAGCMRLKGTASCFDLHRVHREIVALRESVETNARAPPLRANTVCHRRA